MQTQQTTAAMTGQLIGAALHHSGDLRSGRTHLDQRAAESVAYLQRDGGQIKMSGVEFV